MYLGQACADVETRSSISRGFQRDLNHGKVPRCPEVDEPLEQVELIVALSHEIYVGELGFIAFNDLAAVPLLVVMESEVPELRAC